MTSTRRLIIQKARRHPLRDSDRLYANGFRFYCTPLFTVLFTFPSQYWFTIGLPILFSLAGWTPRILTGLHVTRHTQEKPSHHDALPVRDSHPLRSDFPDGSGYGHDALTVTLLPRRGRNNYGLGCSLFARHYSGNRYFFLFLQVMRCFSSLRMPTALQCAMSSTWRVDPFGYVRIESRLQIPAPFRSLPRPSSLLEAQASSVCTSLLLCGLIKL